MDKENKEFEIKFSAEELAQEEKKKMIEYKLTEIVENIDKELQMSVFKQLINICFSMSDIEISLPMPDIDSYCTMSDEAKMITTDKMTHFDNLIKALIELKSIQVENLSNIDKNLKEAMNQYLDLMTAPKLELKILYSNIISGKVSELIYSIIKEKK